MDASGPDMLVEGGAASAESMTVNRKKSRTVDHQVEAAVGRCAERGIRMTELRTAVYRLILEAGTPLTAYQLLDRLREQRANAVPPTVYRALEFLLEQHLIHKVERLNAFVSCRDGGSHDHDHAAQFLICGRCGAVAEIEDAAVTTALESAARRSGFRARVATVELDGTCAACA